MNNKVLLVTDLHFGKSNGKFDNIIYKGIEELCNYAKKNNITTLLNLGDTFDLKQQISTTTLNYIAKSFNLMNNTFMNIHTIVGNHDLQKKIYNDDGHNLNILTAYSNVSLINKPTMININNHSIFAVPYIPNELISSITFQPADYCIGHFEVKGFMLNGFVKAEDGIESTSFSSLYKEVFLGHFHKRQKNRNISYIGNLCSFFYGENDEPRGWMELDLDTNTTKYIEYEHPRLYKFKLTELLNQSEHLDSIFKKGDNLKLVVDVRIDYADFEELKTLLTLDLGINNLVIEEQYFAFDIDDFDIDDNDNSLEEEPSFMELCINEIKKHTVIDDVGETYLRELINTSQV